jgi:hypothetical protein
LLRSGCLIAVDHHHARASRKHRLGAGQSDAPPVTAATLPSNSFAIFSLLLMSGCHDLKETNIHIGIKTHFKNEKIWG